MNQSPINVTFKKVHAGFFKAYHNGVEIGSVERWVGINNRPIDRWGYTLDGISVTNPSWNRATKAAKALANKYRKARSE